MKIDVRVNSAVFEAPEIPDGLTAADLRPFIDGKERTDVFAVDTEAGIAMAYEVEHLAEGGWKAKTDSEGNPAVKEIHYKTFAVQFANEAGSIYGELQFPGK